LEKEFSCLGRQPEGKFEYLAVERKAKDELLLCLPSSEPFRVCVEEYPAPHFWICAVQMRLAQAILAEELDQVVD
jgi:hypothetical protein